MAMLMPTPSPRRRIILHVGFHKTGTKTLQACLRGNAERLGPAWIVQTRPDNDALRAVVEAARDYSASGERADLAMVSAQTVLWLGGLEIEPGQGVLVSSEDFAGHMPGRFGVKDYSAVANVLHAVIGMGRKLFDGHVSFEVLITTRARESWLRSLYFQQAKHPDLMLDFDTFCATIPNAADHGAIAAMVQRKLGDVPVVMRSLGDLGALPLGPAQAMFDLAGIDATGFEPSTARNIMPAPDLAEALVAANRLRLPLPVLKRMKDDLTNAAVSKAKNLG